MFEHIKKGDTVFIVYDNCYLKKTYTAEKKVIRTTKLWIVVEGGEKYSRKDGKTQYFSCFIRHRLLTTQ